jgi:hypothetical protein
MCEDVEAVMCRRKRRWRRLCIETPGRETGQPEVTAQNQIIHRRFKLRPEACRWQLIELHRTNLRLALAHHQYIGQNRCALYSRLGKQSFRFENAFACCARACGRETLRVSKQQTAILAALRLELTMCALYAQRLFPSLLAARHLFVGSRRLTV